jgi:2-methylfumaryl-CoA isomerase
MNRLLQGVRVIEASSFIAAPSCALHLAQFGAEVIRIDQVGGGPDFYRWPLAPETGTSFYWEGLNKGKRSIAIDLTKREGRFLAMDLIAAPDENAGLLVTNFPVDGFLSYAKLKLRRQDLICIRVMGWPDGRSAVDYTVNAAVGIPAITGPKNYSGPVNHVLPAWDLLTGSYAAFSLVSAERARRQDGLGHEIRIALSDVAIASLGQLGQIAEVHAAQADRERMGNQLFGAFGRDFGTNDGRRVMVVAITARQWRALVEALSLEAEIGALESRLGVQFDQREGERFRYRDVLNPLIESAIERRSLGELASAFDARAVCWSTYQTLHQAISSDPIFSAANPMLSAIEHPGGRYLTPGAPVSVSSEPRRAPSPAPRLGRDTVQVLSEVLHLSTAAIGALHDQGIVASA